MGFPNLGVWGPQNKDYSSLYWAPHETSISLCILLGAVSYLVHTGNEKASCRTERTCPADQTCLRLSSQKRGIKGVYSPP